MKPFLCSAILAGLALTSCNLLADEPPAIDIPFDKFQLDNGLTVIVHEDHKAPIVAVSIWYHVGSKDEPPGKTGFAHLFEHLMFNGSENHRGEYFEPFEQVGATSMNGTTWFDRTNYFETVPTPALDMALWMESDRMGHLLGAVTQDILNEQRGVVQNEKRQGDSQPYGTVEYRQLEGLFPTGHPYRHSTIGSMADLDAASLDDVKNWFRKYYGAANTVLVLAGDVDSAKARALAEKYFGDIPSGPPVEHLKTMVPGHASNTLEVMHDRVPHTRSYRSWTIPGRTRKENAQLALAAKILGSGKNSRLYQALVYQKQLATNISASIEQHELASIFTIDTTLRDGASLDEVNTLIDQLLADFLDKGPSADELERVKASTNASIVRGLERIGGFSGKATALARGELYAGDPGFFKTKIAWMNAATPADVHAAAAGWLAQGYYRLDVLPFGDYKTRSSAVDRSKGLPKAGDLPDLTFPTVQRAALDNGLRVVLAERHTVPVVNVALQFDAGHAADSFAKPGTADFTLSMLQEGTSDRSAHDISLEGERLGAVITASSTLDTSSVSLSALRRRLQPSLELYADVVRNPVFKQTEIDRLKPRWIARIRQEQSQPVALALRNLPPLLYGKDHAYGVSFTGSGTLASIKSLTRSDLQKFHATWLRPDNATLFVVGDTTLEEILPLLNKTFGNWRADGPPPPKKNLASVSLPSKTHIYIIDKPGSPQSLILAGEVAPSTAAPDNLAIETMNDILGGEFSARINMNLREDKSWSYGAYSFMPDARGQRPWLVYAPVQTDKTMEAMHELEGEIDRYLSTKPATRKELEKSVHNNVYSLPGEFETSGAVLEALLSNRRFDRPDDYVTTLKSRYEGLNLENVQAAAEEVLHPDKLTWLVVGDRKKIEANIRALNLGEVSIMDLEGNIIH